MKIFTLVSLFLLSSAWGQTHQSTLALLNATPFDCNSFSRSIATPQGYNVLSDPGGAAIIQRFVEIADRDCVATFTHYYAWTIGEFGTRPGTALPTPQPRAERTPGRRPAPPERGRQRGGARLCLPFEIPFLGCRNQDRDRERREAEDERRQSLPVASGENTSTAPTSRWSRSAQNLTLALTGVNGTASMHVSETGAPQCLTPDTSIDFLLRAVREGRRPLQCVLPARGESKIVTHLDGPSPSGTGTSYTLRNRGNGEFDVLIPVRFTALPGATTDEATMLQRAQACLREASPYMRTPRGRLNIQVLGEAETAALPPSERAPVTNINILGPVLDEEGKVVMGPNGLPLEERGNSGNYTSAYDCPTITHEVMHMLGLCDEYAEKHPEADLTNPDPAIVAATVKARAKALAELPGECRAVPGLPSVMNNQHQAYEQLHEQAITCSCDATCQAIMAQPGSALHDFYTAPRFADLVRGQFRGDHCRIGSSASTSSFNGDGTALSAQVESPLYTRYTERRLSGTPSNPMVTQNDLVCECPEGDQACIAELGEMNAKVRDRTLQSSALNCFNGDYPAPGGSIHRRREGEAEGFQGTSYTRTRPAQADSLLHPAHYDRVIAGNCPSLARKYNECAIWARRNAGDQINGCADRPAHCSDPAKFLGPQQ